MDDIATSEERARLDDIATSEDCAALVRAFYSRALTDEVIGFIFTDVAHLDLDHHLPRITRFWETVLLDARSYGGGAFRPHLEINAQVPLRRGHFERWLWLWETTVDERFRGPVAEEAKRHARRVAGAFHARIEAINAQRPATGTGELPLAPPQASAATPAPAALTVIPPARPTDVVLTVIPPDRS